MTRKLLGVMLACAVMLLTVTHAVPAAELAKPAGKSFLWKVQAKGGTAYLFGSVHLARPDSYPLPRQVEDSFARSGTLALEADPDAAMAEDLQQRLIRSAFYPGTDTLRRHLSQDTFDLAGRQLEQLGLSIEQFARSKPWFLAMTIEVAALQRLGYLPENGLDLYFAGKARGGKKIVELESFDYQLQLLNGFNDRDQELFLLYTIQEQASTRERMAELMQAWQSGDAESMEKIVLKAVNDAPETRPIYEKLYYQRNRELAVKVEQLLRSEENSFIVVGAAHLVGPEGIVALLKRKGYRVEQL